VLAGASFSAWLVLIDYLLPAKGGAFGALTRRPSGSGGSSQQPVAPLAVWGAHVVAAGGLFSPSARFFLPAALSPGVRFLPRALLKFAPMGQNQLMRLKWTRKERVRAGSCASPNAIFL
jgi:hypothetical protein